MAKPTEAQRKALEVLQIDGFAFVSNHTSSPKVARASKDAPRHIYWQTARWLVNSGFAVHDGWQDGQEKLVITDAGRSAA